MSDADDRAYEGKFSNEDKPVFPHKVNEFVGKNYTEIANTPHGNTLTFEFAKQAILSEGLGTDDVPDFLAVSFSSPDYIGHKFGPNSVEVEDNYLRLDRELASFFKFLDAKFGKNYTVFLTADHGVANSPAYSRVNKLPGGATNPASSEAVKNTIAKFGVKNFVENFSNYQVYLNRRAIDSAKLNFGEIKSYFIEQLNKEASIHYAFDNEEISDAHLPGAIKERFINGLYPKLGGDIQVIMKSGYYPWNNEGTGATHGAWYAYDAHIPFVLMGWGINKGVLHRNVYMSDIAPTICSLLRIQMPSGNVGNAVGEAIR
jgi:arylsulfatase A-like enzyme